MVQTEHGRKDCVVSVTADLVFKKALSLWMACRLRYTGKRVLARACSI